ncbi:MAG: GC-type dockerin domain-anchored protein [Planctomycetota bacterium]
MINQAAATLPAALFAAIAAAQPATLTIDESLSTINVFATASTPVGSDDDSANSAVAGTIEITLDDYTNPTQITVNDFMFALTTDPELNFGFGALGSAEATLASAVATFAGGAPIGPVPVTAGAFDFTAVPTLLMGTADFSYSFFLVGSDSGTVDLSTFGANDSPFVGAVISDGTTVTLNAAFNLDATVPVVPDLVDVTLIGTAALVASGPVPAGPTGCNPADLAEPFGVTDLSDVDAFIAAFVAGDAAADIAAPFGVVDLTDVDAFIAAFLAGCP